MMKWAHSSHLSAAAVIPVDSRGLAELIPMWQYPNRQISLRSTRTPSGQHGALYDVSRGATVLRQI